MTDLIFTEEKTMKLNPDIVRQGDVTLVRVKELPVRKAEAKRGDDGKLIIEHGEMTGHGHRIADSGAQGFRVETAEMAGRAGLDFVLVGGGGATLRHEYADGRHAEHEPINLGEGAWTRAVQVDEDDEGAREVVD